MKRSEIERKTPLKRKTPIARKKAKLDTPKPPRAPMRKKKPSVAAAQYAQKRLLNIRSGGRCEMEVYITPLSALGKVWIWERCPAFGQDAAHVFTRPKCGAARDLVDAVIHACRACHEASEGKLGANGVLVPLNRAQAAWDLILAHSKLGVSAEDRLRIHIGSVGERPERGTTPYV